MASAGGNRLPGWGVHAHVRTVSTCEGQGVAAIVGCVLCRVPLLCIPITVLFRHNCSAPLISSPRLQVALVPFQISVAKPCVSHQDA